MLTRPLLRASAVLRSAVALSLLSLLPSLLLLLLLLMEVALLPLAVGELGLLLTGSWMGAQMPVSWTSA